MRGIFQIITKKINDKIKNNNSNKKIDVEKKINKKKLSFKDAYDLERLPLQIEKLERELEEYENILNNRDLYKNDRKTFDKVVADITNIKIKISEAENKWLKLQILNDEINKSSKLDLY